MKRNGTVGNYLHLTLHLHRYLSRDMRKPTMWFLTRSDINQAVQPLEIARGLKFRSQEVEGLYYPSSENKDADQLRGYREADLRLCFANAERWFSHDAAHDRWKNKD